MTRLLSATALVVSLAGCGAGGLLGSDAGGSGADSGSTTMDAGPGSPDGGRSAHRMEGFAPDANGMGLGTPSDFTALLTGDLGQLYTCYDGADNDGMMTGADCADPGCAFLASCCPGPGLSCCDSPTRATLPTFCDGDLAACATGFTVFGTPTPYAHSGAVFPAGDHSEDSGIVLSDVLDGTIASVVEATFTLPDPSTCTATPPCIESAAVGFVPAATSFGATSTVRPVIGVVASATLGTVNLVGGDVVLASTPVPGPGGSFPVSLVLSAGGVVEATIGTVLLRARVPAARVPLRLAVWGHDENRDAASAPTSANVQLTGLAQAACDVPSVWRSRAPVVLGASGGAAPDVEEPSVAYVGTEGYLAFASRGAIFVAHRSTPTDFQLQAGYDAPTIGIAGTTDYGEPDLQALPGGGTRLWFVNRATSAILASDADVAAPLVFGAPQPVLGVGDAVLSTIGVATIDGPSLLPPTGALSPGWVMALRVHLMSGEARIVLLLSADGLHDWSLRGGSLETATVRIPADAAGVAQDEAAAPSLLFRNGGFQLYYAGRTFGRWGIGVVLSDTLDFWRPGPSPVVLAGAGGAAFDAFGVRDPSVSTVAGDASLVEMFYSATDGTTTSIGRVERPAATAWPGHPILTPIP